MAGRNDKPKDDKPGFMERTLGQIAPALGRRGREERAKQDGAIAKVHRERTEAAIEGRPMRGKPTR